MTDRELMQMALDALELVTDLTNHDDELYEAIEALRARLAQPEREWQGLTNEEIVQVLGNLREQLTGNVFLAFARAIEAKLKEKNA